ncbi:hypothetical protein [Geobacter sp.]|uniref:hypothetical protein n=1 Tax=Geobacter sp. TaxID=46610 RepID=UPI0026324637|nr:hypothetical protein [Geobacter sp.]
MATKPIDAKFLKGLVFRSSEPQKTEEGTRHAPTKRDLEPADVLDWKDNGATITIVTADGQKHTVDKKAKE